MDGPEDEGGAAEVLKSFKRDDDQLRPRLINIRALVWFLLNRGIVIGPGAHLDASQEGEGRVKVWLLLSQHLVEKLHPFTLLHCTQGQALVGNLQAFLHALCDEPLGRLLVKLEDAHAVRLMRKLRASSHSAKALYGLFTLSMAATTLAQISSCNGKTLPLGSTTLCIEPSLVPMAGGAVITMKGLNSAVFPSWSTDCNQMDKWKCVIGYSESSSSENIPLSSVNCEQGFAECVSPSRKTIGDVPFYLQFMDGNTVVMLPTPASGNLYLSYFGESIVMCCICCKEITPCTGISKMKPISGISGMQPTVTLTLLNSKNITQFQCKFVPFGDGWLDISIQPLIIADYKGAGQIGCRVPDGILLLSPKYQIAQVQILVTVLQTGDTSSSYNATYTDSQWIFSLYRAFNVTGANLLLAPYSGGTDIYVSGEGFYSFPGLSCRLKWCLDYTVESTCQTTLFASALFMNDTTIKCVTGSYFPGDPDCNTQVDCKEDIGNFRLYQT
eukprot:748537-Hanusia_phi.AAC.6